MNLFTAVLCLALACQPCFSYRLHPSHVCEAFRSLYGSASSPAAPQVCYVPPDPVPLSAGALTDILDSLEQNISALWNEETRPGGLVANLIYDQEIIWAKGFGKRNNSAPGFGPPDGDTAFRIGSISKVFTTLLALQYRDEARWGLDDAVGDYLREFSVINPFKTARAITLRQLASHLSGLPRETPCAGMFETGCDESAEVIFQRLHETVLERPPGLKPDYSNLGFALLGHAEEVLTSQSWVEQVNRLAGQLKMSNTYAAIPRRPDTGIAEGYMADGSQAAWIDIGFEAPAGQIFSSTNDLAELVRLIFRQNKTSSLSTGQVLDGETLREWMQPVYVADDRTGFGLVWELLRGGNYTFLTKGGAINGYRAFMFFLHEIKVGGVALLSNEQSSLLNNVIRAQLIAALAIEDILKKHQPPPKLPPLPDEYTGSYVSGAVVVNISLATLADGHEHLIISGVSRGGTLEWRSKDLMQISVKDLPHYCSAETDNGDMYVYFQRDSSGKITTATVPGFDYGLVLRKQL